MTHGNPTKLIISFAVPLLLGNIFQQLYNMVDTLIVGRGVGVNALAALGATSSINFLVLGFVIGLTTGFSILISQYYGADDYNNMKKAVAMSCYLSLVIGLIISLLSVIFTPDLLRLLNTPLDIFADAVLYIQIIFGGIIVTVAYNLLSGILRALGDSKTPLYAMIISSIINIILDIYFVMGLNMGVSGAAIATVIAQIASVIFCLARLVHIPVLHTKKEHWRVDQRLLVRLVKLGVPVAFMNSVTAIGVMVLQFVVNDYGSTYVAAYSTANKVTNIVMQPGVTFGFAMATYAGQNLGAKKFERISLGLNKTVMLSTIFNLFVAMILIVFGKSILGAIVGAEEVEVIRIAQEYLVICSCALWVLGLLFIYRSTLQGMGDTLVPMISGVVEFVLRIVVALALPFYLGFKAIATAEIAAWIGAAIILILAYYIRIHQLKKKRGSIIV